MKTPIDKWEIVLVDLGYKPGSDVHLRHKGHSVSFRWSEGTGWTKWDNGNPPYCAHCKEPIPEEIVTKYTRMSKFLLP